MTGVQTCALPICGYLLLAERKNGLDRCRCVGHDVILVCFFVWFIRFISQAGTNPKKSNPFTPQLRQLPGRQLASGEIIAGDDRNPRMNHAVDGYKRRLPVNHQIRVIRQPDNSIDFVLLSSADPY